MTATFLSLLGSKDGFGAVVAEVAEAVERKRGKGKQSKRKEVRKSKRASQTTPRFSISYI